MGGKEAGRRRVKAGTKWRENGCDVEPTLRLRLTRRNSDCHQWNPRKQEWSVLGKAAPSGRGPIRLFLMTPTPSHDDVAQCARELWQSYGQPEGRDQEIWLEAERKLAAQAKSAGKAQSAGGTKSGGTIDPERLKTEMAAESVEEFNLDAGTSDQAAIKAALQTTKRTPAPKTPATAAKAPAPAPAKPAAKSRKG